MVLRVDLARWGQTPEDLRHLAVSAPHARTRERALALFDITQHRCVTQVAVRTGRRAHTVMGRVSSAIAGREQDQNTPAARHGFLRGSGPDEQAHEQPEIVPGDVDQIALVDILPARSHVRRMPPRSRM